MENNPEQNKNELNELMSEGYALEQQQTLLQEELLKINQSLAENHRRQEFLIRQEVFTQVVKPAMEGQFSLRDEIQARNAGNN